MKKNKPTGTAPKKTAAKKATITPKVVEEKPTGAMKGIVTEADLLEKADSIRATGEGLPEEHKMHIDAGTVLEETLIDLAENPEGNEGEGEEKPEAKEQAPQPMNAASDVIAEMENNIILRPLEEGLDLKKDFLIITADEQRLLGMVRPDDMEIKRSAEWYWGIFLTLNISKLLKWFLFNLRKKKEAKKRAEELAKRKKEMFAEDAVIENTPDHVGK